MVSDATAHLMDLGTTIRSPSEELKADPEKPEPALRCSHGARVDHQIQGGDGEKPRAYFGRIADHDHAHRLT